MTDRCPSLAKASPVVLGFGSEKNTGQPVFLAVPRVLFQARNTSQSTGFRVSPVFVGSEDLIIEMKCQNPNPYSIGVSKNNAKGVGEMQGMRHGMIPRKAIHSIWFRPTKHQQVSSERFRSLRC